MSVSNIIQNIILEPKSAVGVYDLPGGWVNGETLEREFKVREMTGYEEDLLANPAVSPTKKFQEIMLACVERVGAESSKEKLGRILMDLSAEDRLFILIAIRQTTFGDLVPVEYDCDKCSKKSTFNVSLREMEVIAPKNPLKKVFEVKLPSGKTAIFHRTTGADESKIANIKTDSDRLSRLMAVRVDTLDGEPASVNSLKGLSMRDRSALREAFEAEDGGIEMGIEVQCPLCGHEFHREFSVGEPGFFSPSTVTKH